MFDVCIKVVVTSSGMIFVTSSGAGERANQAVTTPDAGEWPGILIKLCLLSLLEADTNTSYLPHPSNWCKREQIPFLKYLNTCYPGAKSKMPEMSLDFSVNIYYINILLTREKRIA